MWYMSQNTNTSGAYCAPRSNPFPNAIPLTDDQVNFLVARNGFINVANTPDPDIEGSTVTLTENTTAWEAWKSEEAAKAAEPPAPTQLDRVEAQAAYTAMMTNTMMPEV